MSAPIKIPPSQLKPFDKMTKRELEIVSLAAQGHAYLDIAKELNLTVSTVTKHAYNAIQKIDAKNMRGLVYYALSKNLISIQHPNLTPDS